MATYGPQQLTRPKTMLDAATARRANVISQIVKRRKRAEKIIEQRRNAIVGAERALAEAQRDLQAIEAEERTARAEYATATAPLEW